MSPSESVCSGYVLVNIQRHSDSWISIAFRTSSLVLFQLEQDAADLAYKRFRYKRNDGYSGVMLCCPTFDTRLIFRNQSHIAYQTSRSEMFSILERPQPVELLESRNIPSGCLRSPVTVDPIERTTEHHQTVTEQPFLKDQTPPSSLETALLLLDMLKCLLPM